MSSFYPRFARLGRTDEPSDPNLRPRLPKVNEFVPKTQGRMGALNREFLDPMGMTPEEALHYQSYLQQRKLMEIPDLNVLSRKRFASPGFKDAAQNRRQRLHRLRLRSTEAFAKRDSSILGRSATINNNEIRSPTSSYVTRRSRSPLSRYGVESPASSTERPAATFMPSIMTPTGASLFLDSLSVSKSQVIRGRRTK